MFPDRMPQWGMLVLGIVVGSLAITRTSVADGTTIPTVTLGASGVDKALPLGSDFYLAGAADPSVKEVHVVIVRTSWPFLGLGGTDVGECRKLNASFGDGPPKFDQVGLTTANEVWAAAEELPALVPDRWKRAATEDKYQVLIPASSFFRQGASYCLFSYLKKEVSEKATVNFQNLLLDYGREVNACIAAGLPAVANYGKLKAACEEQSVQKLHQSVTDAFSPKTGKDADPKKVDEKLDPKQVDAAWQAIRGSLANSAEQLLGIPPVIQKIVGRWGAQVPAQYGPDGTLYRTDPPVRSNGTWTPPPEPLGYLMAELLARKQELLRAPTGGFLSVTNEPVLRIGLASDYQSFKIEVQQAAAKGPPVHAIESLPMTADALVLPESTLTLSDVWHLANGQLKLNGKYLRISDLWSTTLADAFALSPTNTVAVDKLATIQALSTTVTSIDDALTTILQTQANDARVTGQSLLVLQQVLVEYEHANKQVGLFTGQDGPVQALDSYLQEYLNDAKAWNNAPQVIKDKTNIAWDTGVVSASGSASLTQQRWFDTYFTPVVGRVNVRASTASFSEWYTGVQIFAYANAVNEPMWVNGSDDWRRFLGLELAMIPKTGAFGPNGRFSGFDGTGSPALMIGAVLQPLPYTTVSGGFTWYSERTSRIAAEDPSGKFSPYIAIAVQANVPGIIRAIATKANGTALTDGASK